MVDEVDGLYLQYCQEINTFPLIALNEFLKPRFLEALFMWFIAFDTGYYHLMVNFS
jgi:hypothetical protein